MEFDAIVESLTELEDLAKTRFEAHKDQPQAAQTASRHIQTLQDAIFALKQYVEPWTCPDCGDTVKIPASKVRPRYCQKCKNEQMMPYAYLEQERMSGQLKLTLQCVQHYAKEPNGGVALECLNQLPGAGRPKKKP